MVIDNPYYNAIMHLYFIFRITKKSISLLHHHFHKNPHCPADTIYIVFGITKSQKFKTLPTIILATTIVAPTNTNISIHNYDIQFDLLSHFPDNEDILIVGSYWPSNVFTDMVMVMSLHKETVPIFCQYFHGNAQIPAHAHGKIVLCIVPSKNQILSTPYHNNKLFCLFPSLIAFTFAEETTNMSPSLMYRQHIGPSNNISCASSTVLQKEFFLPQPMIILLAHI